MKVCVTTVDLADELGLTPETIARWARDGKLKGAFHRRGRWRIPAEVAQAVAARYEANAQDFDDEEFADMEDMEE